MTGRRLGGLWPGVLAGAIIGWASWAMAQAPAERAAVFTGDQAARGQATYSADCSACHGPRLGGGPGGPPLIGDAFRSRWQPQTAEALFSYIREKMPPGAGRSMEDPAYAEIVAHLLKANGAPAGATPLSADASQLRSVTLAQAVPPAPRAPKAPRPPRGGAPALDSVALDSQARHREILQRLRPVTDQMLRDPPAGSWLSWRATYDAHGFSPAAQIDRRNAKHLGVAWSWQLAGGVNQITPLEHDGVLFVASAGRVQALDAATGDLLWQYQRPTRVGISRSIAIYGELLYYAAETSVVALDIHTGKVVWDRLIVSPDAGVRFGAGPIAAKGKIFQGMGYCIEPYPGGCFIVALDALTGQELWRFNTIARPGQPGGDSWNGAPVDERYGASVWIAGSYDPELDLLFFGTGQTYKTATLIRGPSINDRAAGLYTDTTLALRPETGQLVWHYQHMPGDVWDLDWAFERTVATLDIGGKKRRTVTTAGKIAVFDTLDAATGQYLFSRDMGLQTLVTAIDPRTGAKTVNPEVMPEPGKDKRVCPDTLGGRNWQSTAFNPRTGVLYAPLNETCMIWSWLPGGPFDWTSARVWPKPGETVGRLAAVDLASGRTLWTRKQRAPQVSAVLATGGGLIFEGTKDRWFRASDDRTGKVLWQVRLDASPSSFPITYMVDGVQYVAVTTGGGGSHENNIGQLAPEITSPAAGGVTLWVFRLPPRS